MLDVLDGDMLATPAAQLRGHKTSGLTAVGVQRTVSQG
jgi:hypothetical protein